LEGSVIGLGIDWSSLRVIRGKRLPQIWNALATTPEQRVWAETMATMTAAGGLIIGFLSIFLTWIISTGVLYFIARVLGGRGDLVRFGKIMGWCMAPYVFNAVVGLIVAIRFPIRIFLPIPVGKISPAEASQYFQNITKVIMSLESVKASIVADQFTSLWVLLLSGIAVYKEHEVSKIRAIITVLLPYLIYHAISLHSMWRFWPGF